MKQQRKRRKQHPFYIAFALVVALLAGLQALFHFRLPATATAAVVAPLQQIPQSTTVYEDVQTDDDESEAEEADALAEAAVDTVIEAPIQTSVGTRRGTYIWSYAECFCDSQATQLSAALLNGITPAESRDQLQAMLNRHQLIDIRHSSLYAVDPLNHSMPYLVPKAQQLLNTIAINFLDSLHRKGLPLHRPIVSSVLRTVDDVARLQQGNKNATTNSCHSYGTTIDITYHRFQPLSSSTRHNVTRYDDDLKYVLAQVLFDLRRQGRCYVKYEHKQACFHLTVR